MPKLHAKLPVDAADASDHEGSVKALIAGLVEGHSKERPGYYLHTGGTGILTFEDSENDRLGEHSDKEYNDWNGVEDLTNLPDSAFHRNVDKIVLEAGLKHADVLKTVIVCPPTIYGGYVRRRKVEHLLTRFPGKGRGPVSGRGRQAYELTKLILTGKYIPVVGAGQARWNSVHVADLSQMFRLLVEAAVSGNKDPELWGEKGYLLAENGEHVWADLAERIAREAEKQGVVQGSLDKKGLSKDKALEQAGFEAVSWGFNSRGKAERARKVLGWKPVRGSIEEEAPAFVKEEKERIEKGESSPQFRKGAQS